MSPTLAHPSEQAFRQHVIPSAHDDTAVHGPIASPAGPVGLAATPLGRDAVGGNLAHARERPRLRVGGLPLPGTTSPGDADGPAGANTVLWDCRFPVAADGRDAAAPRRAGGLSMPDRSAPHVGQSPGRGEAADV